MMPASVIVRGDEGETRETGSSRFKRAVSNSQKKGERTAYPIADTLCDSLSIRAKLRLLHWIPPWWRCWPL
jgi:hypothetical protein